MSDKPSAAQIANPKTHYGDARASTRHFITQRVTGAINIVFALFLVWFVVSLAGTDRAGMIAIVASPFVAIVLGLLIVSVMVHMRNGMRDVLEDYFAGAEYRRYMAANTGFAIVIAVVTLGSIAKIVFWG